MRGWLPHVALFDTNFCLALILKLGVHDHGGHNDIDVVSHEFGDLPLFRALLLVRLQTRGEQLLCHLLHERVVGLHVLSALRRGNAVDEAEGVGQILHFRNDNGLPALFVTPVGAAEEHRLTLRVLHVHARHVSYVFASAILLHCRRHERLSWRRSPHTGGE